MLRNEIDFSYTDMYGLVAPRRVDFKERGSDNGVLFTNLYYGLLKQLKQGRIEDWEKWKALMRTCFNQDGVLCRVPGDTGQEGPDDYLGLLYGCTVFRDIEFPRKLVDIGYQHYGCFNNSRTTSFSWVSCLWRQPQIYTAMLAASYKLRLRHLPLVIYTALLIALSNRRSEYGNSNDRQLNWLLIQIMSPESWLCRLASKVWFRRIQATYKRGYKDVLAIYYGEDHPFTKYYEDC
jgi:hypothetical protein